VILGIRKSPGAVLMRIMLTQCLCCGHIADTLIRVSCSDRSWARRARGGGRKRPDLLSADFSGERERPSSPSPLVETKPLLPSAQEGDSKPK
jgi:hypothetical protein